MTDHFHLDPQLRRLLERLATDENLPCQGPFHTIEEVEDRYPGIQRAIERGFVVRFQYSTWDHDFYFDLTPEGRVAIGLPPKALQPVEPLWPIIKSYWARLRRKQ